MSVTVNKTKTDAYKVAELQRQINADPLIVPSCLSVTASGDDLALEFASALSGAEDTQLDAVIAAHVPSSDTIDVAQLTFSDLDGKKLSVHPSYKPEIVNGTTYAVWAGCGDDVNADPNLSVLGGGDLLHFNMTPGNALTTVDVKFDHTAFGRVWVHEAYLKFTDAGEGDCISADFMAAACPLQQSVNLDLELSGDLVKLAAGGPGTGTHGFGGTPALIPRLFQKDGDWDYDEVNGLVPNVSGTGNYQIRQVDAVANRFVNKIPCFGSCPYFSMTSDETSELLEGYFIRINVQNNSDTTWHASVIMELYRERTI